MLSTRLAVIKKIFSNMLNLLSPYERRFLDKVLHQSFLGHADFYTEHFHSYWERLTSSWGQMSSPIRPSKGDCEIYQDYLSRKKEVERVLILGSTPEVRDLAAKLPKAKIYVADFSHQMLSGMVKFIRHADPTKEIWIKDDWLSLFLSERSFDVIIGDLVLQQIPPENEKVFLKKVNSLLKKDGIFISRFHFISERFQSKTIEEIVKKVEVKKRSYNEKVTLIRLWVWERFSDPESRKMDRCLAAREYTEFIKRTKMSDEAIKKVEKTLIAWENAPYTWSPPTEKQLVDGLSDYFTIVDRKVATDHEDAIYYPIFNLSPKIK
ncbi:MAG: hypothetical protein UX06_C0041G0004 [Candidatus Giovannonibacteria bacterium GW2011_GWA2_45_21]|uniref:Methyltransferase domain-containing protein n=2 Tax=Parcubacteria group TaxID=1794811 RepID=A0A0G1M613_9BACT|nr:MAG: hypothetical protein UX06_C0041G0004 [Candidatus Giovannonibacteria bacterium GW2011_GWA2_45_21]